MAAPLKGCCFVGDKEYPFLFESWLPYELPDILIGIDPNLSLLKKMISPHQASWHLLWKHKTRSINMHFLPPMGASMWPADAWRSESVNSSSLYPWWCTLKDANNNTPPIDLILQIHPQGSSSEHAHEQEPGIDVVEQYAPILCDGATKLWIEGKKPIPLVSQQSILPNQSHQLIRKAPGFSIHLLLMRSNKYRFPDRRGHIPCNRLRLRKNTPTP